MIWHDWSEGRPLIPFLWPTSDALWKADHGVQSFRHQYYVQPQPMRLERPLTETEDAPIDQRDFLIRAAVLQIAQHRQLVNISRGIWAAVIALCAIAGALNN